MHSVLREVLIALCSWAILLPAAASVAASGDKPMPAAMIEPMSSRTTSSSWPQMLWVADTSVLMV